MRATSRLRTLLALGSILAALPASAAPDPWEGTPLTASERASCHEVPRTLTAPVVAARRDDGAAMLADREIDPLTDAQAAEFLGLAPEIDRSLAQRRLATAIGALERQRDAVVRRGEGEWRAYDLQQLDALIAYRDAHPLAAFRPYLVRAVAKFEGTGAFFVSDCGEVLSVAHGSLGRSTPPTAHVPLIVFLDHAPKRVHATWSIAE